MPQQFDIISPVDCAVYANRMYLSDAKLADLLESATMAQLRWAACPLPERIRRCRSMVDLICKQSQEFGEELTWMMGRPQAQTRSEFDGVRERAEYLLDNAADALSGSTVTDANKQQMRISRVACGVVLIISPWNYPYLTTINSLIPSLLAGNSVILKASPQTPMMAEHFASAALEAGIPAGVLSAAHCTIEQTQALVADPHIDHVVFTGSVAVGRVIGSIAGRSLTACTLELGGKDPAYVRADSNIEFAAAALADGAFYNAGQSCCAIERIYVDKRIYSKFVDALGSEMALLQLGNPFDDSTTLGPVVNGQAAERIRMEVDQAIAQGAQAVSNASGRRRDLPPTYVEPSILTNVRQDMRFMQAEVFGPTVGVMPVNDDEDALSKMNNSSFGLSASVWTTDTQAADQIGARLEAGTWFLNRCDYLAPSLPWSGRKHSGIGCSLSALGFLEVTRPKSALLRLTQG